MLWLMPMCLSAQAQRENFANPRFSGETLSVNVDVVDVFFNVKSHDKFVENLTKHDFTIYENGRKQTIRYFSAETHAPLSLGLLIDTSDSEKPVLQREHEVAKQFLDQVLTAGDEGLVVTFDSNIDLKRDFTGDHEELLQAISMAKREFSSRHPELDSGPMPKLRSTALYDSITAVARKRFARRNGRKAMIIITDGQDMGSKTSGTQAIDAALRSDTICYVLLVGDSRYMGSTGYQGIQRMERLSQETGGRMIEVHKDMKRLEKSLLEIAKELRHHYSIGYTPTDRDYDGEYRTISIRSAHGYNIQSRRGYFAVRHQKPEEHRLEASN